MLYEMLFHGLQGFFETHGLEQGWLVSGVYDMKI